LWTLRTDEKRKRCFSSYQKIKRGQPFTNFNDDFGVTTKKSEAASPVIGGITTIIAKIGEGLIITISL